MKQARYEVWIDRGGTFTDCIGLDRDTGILRVRKLLSSDRAAVDGVRALLGVGPDDVLPGCDIRLGTTLATNALLERRGTPVGLVVTEGFEDLLAIGDQSRPELFALEVKRPAPLTDLVVGIGSRPTATPAEPPVCIPDWGLTRRALEELRAAGCESLAVALLHAYLSPDHERAVGELAREVGFEHVSLSHQVVDERGLVGRASTTVADAYLTPVLQAHVAALATGLPGAELRLMQSCGGLTSPARFRGRNAVLSGPAGGVIACGALARQHGLPAVIGFDMGGTSTDVCRWAGEPERTYECTVDGVPLRAPMLAVHTVAAGGGSICRHQGGRLTVGPESAGASPGPLCYGDPRAVEVTLTDVNVQLGRIQPDRFPVPLAPQRVGDALAAIADGLDDGWDATRVAEGFFRVAVERMASAIREVSLARGFDVREHALVVFGGAGGQHACAIARSLGIRELIFHPLAGVFSAYGMGLAAVTWNGERDAGCEALDQGSWERARASLAALEAQGRAVVRREATPGGRTCCAPRVDMRYRGTDAYLTVTVEAGDDIDILRGRFEREHGRRFGYVRPERPVELVTVRAEVSHQRVVPSHLPAAGKGGSGPIRHIRLWVSGSAHRTPVFRRQDLAVGAELHGPALVLEETATVVLDPGFLLQVLADGTLRVRDQEPARKGPVAQDDGQVDPVELEVYSNLFMSVAEQMGWALRRTAVSTNIRERLDFSCAVFDAAGGLVANAPHIPVHLGAMGESVRAIRELHPEPAVGDVYLTNDPANGGSHLPDLTVVSPVHIGGVLAFFVASRGHHADVGGTTPGSMPAFSSTLAEEGIVFRGLRIVAQGRFDQERLLALFSTGPHPARRPADNLADIEAQIAANRRGEVLLRELVERAGLAHVSRYMDLVQANAEAQVREAIAALPDGDSAFDDCLDDGTPIRVRVAVRGSHMVVDFAGTGASVAGNLNAPRAVTIAAVLYVLRSLVGSPIPLNQGCLTPVDLTIPEGSVLSPPPQAAVAGGNVETSQRVVDVLLGALGLVAASQGTMNNLSFGDTAFGYYETIGGGAGAGPGFSGASGVHTHMTNSRITDPEVLEARFPVRLWRFGLRRGSGGRGEHAGGDGLVREIEALRPLTVSILSERRTRRPFGLAGGEAGQAGENWIGGQRVGGKVTAHVQSGQRVRIETPGGGGYGPARPVAGLGAEQ